MVNFKLKSASLFLKLVILGLSLLIRDSSSLELV